MQLLLLVLSFVGDVLLALLAGLWEFIKGFVMPAAAILASGLVAIRLQRKDHAKREIERKESLAAESAERVHAAKRDLVRHALKSNEPWAEYVQAPSMDARARLTLQLTSTHAEWFLSDVEGARVVGKWLSHCRMVLLQHYIKHSQMDDVDLTVPILYVMNVNYALLEWRDGTKSATWFETEQKRMFDSDPGLEEETERLGGRRPKEN